MPSFDSDPKSREDWLLVYCIRGKIRLQFADDTIIQCQEGQLVTIPSYTGYTAVLTENYSDICICVADLPFYTESASIVSDNAQHYLYATFEQASQLSCFPAFEAGPLLDSIGEMISSYIGFLSEKTRFTPLIAQIHREILRNYMEPDFALDTVLRQQPYQYDYLRKRFKKEVGMSPKAYMAELRMKKARTLLSNSNPQELQISEIALKCGFDNPLYFSRFFKKHHGISPSEYSQRNCQNISSWQESISGVR